MDALSPERLLTFWPREAKPRTRDWLDQNLSGGSLRDIDVAVRRAPDADPQTYLSFDFADAQIRFMKTMPDIEQAAGHASLFQNRFVLAVDKGALTAPQGGSVEMSGSSFIISYSFIFSFWLAIRAKLSVEGSRAFPNWLSRIFMSSLQSTLKPWFIIIGCTTTNSLFIFLTLFF